MNSTHHSLLWIRATLLGLLLLLGCREEVRFCEAGTAYCVAEADRSCQKGLEPTIFKVFGSAAENVLTDIRLLDDDPNLFCCPDGEPGLCEMRVYANIHEWNSNHESTYPME